MSLRKSSASNAPRRDWTVTGKTKYVYLVWVGNRNNTSEVVAAFARKDRAEKHIDHLFACSEGERSNAAIAGIVSSHITRVSIDEY